MRQHMVSVNFKENALSDQLHTYMVDWWWEGEGSFQKWAWSDIQDGCQGAKCENTKMTFTPNQLIRFSPNFY